MLAVLWVGVFGVSVISAFAASLAVECFDDACMPGSGFVPRPDVAREIVAVGVVIVLALLLMISNAAVWQRAGSFRNTLVITAALAVYGALWEGAIWTLASAVPAVLAWSWITVGCIGWIALAGVLGQRRLGPRDPARAAAGRLQPASTK